jgi:hypothetical protein
MIEHSESNGTETKQLDPENNPDGQKNGPAVLSEIDATSKIDATNITPVSVLTIELTPGTSRLHFVGFLVLFILFRSFSSPLAPPALLTLWILLTF